MVGHLEDSQREEFQRGEEVFLGDRLVEFLNHLHAAVDPPGDNAIDSLEIYRLARTYKDQRDMYYEGVELNGGGPHGPDDFARELFKEKDQEPPQWEKFQRLEEEGLRQLLLRMQIHLHKATVWHDDNSSAIDGTVAYRLVRTYKILRTMYFNVVERNGGGPESPAAQFLKRYELDLTGGPELKSMQDLIDQGDKIIGISD